MISTRRHRHIPRTRSSAAFSRLALRASRYAEVQNRVRSCSPHTRRCVLPGFKGCNSAYGKIRRCACVAFVTLRTRTSLFALVALRAGAACIALVALVSPGNHKFKCVVRCVPGHSHLCVRSRFACFHTLNAECRRCSRLALCPSAGFSGVVCSYVPVSVVPNIGRFAVLTVLAVCARCACRAFQGRKPLRLRAVKAVFLCDFVCALSSWQILARACRSAAVLAYAHFVRGYNRALRAPKARQSALYRNAHPVTSGLL